MVVLAALFILTEDYLESRFKKSDFLVVFFNLFFAKDGDKS